MVLKRLLDVLIQIWDRLWRGEVRHERHAEEAGR